MLRVKQYDLQEDFIDIVATFPKLECNIREHQEMEYLKGEGKESSWSELEEDRKLELNRERSIQRTKTKVKRYVINRNMRYMWTLTFAKKYIKVGKTEYDMGNLDHVWKVWKAFMKRVERAGMKFEYIVTVEVQEKRLEKYGEKVYHFHFATNVNLPKWTKQAKIRGIKHCIMALWGHGSVDVQKSKSKKKFANVYMMKYITKMFEETSKGSQRYRASQGMTVPCVEKWYGSESELDWYVNKIASSRGLRIWKQYHPLNDGLNEVLTYCLTPKEDFFQAVS